MIISSLPTTPQPSGSNKVFGENEGMREMTAVIEVPKVTSLDVAFGNIKHMPEYKTLPKEFQDYHNERHCDFISKWFFGKKMSGDFKLLKEKSGIDRSAALAAIRAIMVSFEPKHEHKIAGAGYLLSQWFDLSEAA